MFYLWRDEGSTYLLAISFPLLTRYYTLTFCFILPRHISNFTIGFRAQKEVLSRERNAWGGKLARARARAVIRWIINWWIEGVVTRLERVRVAWLRKHLHRILWRTRPKLDPSAAVGLARAPSGYVCDERDGGQTRLCGYICVCMCVHVCVCMYVCQQL